MNKLSYYFQLLEVFTFREIKARYRASLLGPVWIVIYPLLMTFLLYLIFGYFVKIDTGAIPYFHFLFSGLLFWNFFQQGLILAQDSLVWNRELIISSNFPKEVIPLSYILSKVPDFFVNAVILLIALGISQQLKIFFLLIVLYLLPIFFFSSALALILSLSNAVFRDFGRLADFLLLLLFYLTPILYLDSFIPANLKFIVTINPLALIISGARNLLFNNQFRIEEYLYTLIFSLVIFTVCLFVFRKYEKKIADLI